MKNLDLTALNTAKLADEGFELQLLHPATGDPLDCYITVRGTDSQAYREKSLELQRRHLERAQKGTNHKFLVDLKEDEELEVLVELTVGWRGIDLDGNEMTFSTENAKKLYADRGFAWLREQVDRAIARRGNFLPPAATGS